MSPMKLKFATLMKLMFATLVMFICLVSQNVNSELQVGFYSNTCRFAEFIVKDEVRKGFIQNPGIAAGLVRMQFHDCFVRGCDASVLLDSTASSTAEKDSPANKPSLRGFEVIDNAKARLEEACQGIVSCADIVAFAARDSIELSGGIGYDVPGGRRDGKISLALDTRTNLPPPTSNLDQLTKLFASKGLTQEEMVTLSGAHTIGRSFCSSFSSRLYNFSTTSSVDPSLAAAYASQLKLQCPQGNTNTNTVPMDPSSPARADSGYYVNVLANRGLFSSDQALLSSTETTDQVNQNARNQFLWMNKFADAMVKMGQISVLIGNDGEIRINCRKVNN